MKISGPDRYALALTPASHSVRCSRGTPKFSGLATSKIPKLYIVSVDEKPFYVGVTKRRMSDRLRDGWNADGETGYYGYAWRHHHERAFLDVWYHEDPP